MSQGQIDCTGELNTAYILRGIEIKFDSRKKDGCYYFKILSRCVFVSSFHFFKGYRNLDFYAMMSQHFIMKCAG